MLGKRKNNDLLLNQNGGPLTARGVRYLLNKIIQKTSIEKNISPHMLRHSFCDISTKRRLRHHVRTKLLGHANLSATGIYTHVTNDRLKRSILQSDAKGKEVGGFMAKLYFRYGAMNSGKTTLLMQTAHNYEERGMKVLVMKPAKDLKAGEEISSRLGITRKSRLYGATGRSCFNVHVRPHRCILCFGR